MMSKDKEVMLGVPHDDKEEMIELENHRAMLEMPNNAVEAKMLIKVFQDGELIEVSKTLDMDEIRTAFQKADDGYIDDDDRFVITEKGMAWLEEQERKRKQ